MVVSSYIVAAAMNILQFVDTEDTTDVEAELWAPNKDTRQTFLNSITVKIMEEKVDFTFDHDHQPQTNYTECDDCIPA